MMNLFSTIEYTQLNPGCTQAQIDDLVKTAADAGVFGVCVPPYWVKAARRLCSEQLRLVTVIGFPLGYQKTGVKLAEAEEAINDGADELDMVMNISAFQSGMESWVKSDIARLAEACHAKEKFLKVIIETALLSDSAIARASEIAVQAGADFIKTSTGFAAAGAKTEHIRIIRKAIGSAAGIKASGGIKTKIFAEELIAAGADRIGTSSPPAVFF